MPYKNPEDKLAQQRRWYARNREKVIGWTTKRKYTDYAGVCQNCGGPTVGQSKNNIPEWCGKPACKSRQLKELHARTKSRGGEAKSVNVVDEG